MDSITKTMDLVRRAQGGDRDAMDRICKRYYERLRIPVRLGLGHLLRRRLDSNDILQEVFFALIRDFDRFEMRDEASLLKYLCTMAVNAIRGQKDRHTAIKRDVKREVPLVASRRGSTQSSRHLAAVGTPILERLSGREELEVLEQCLRELAEDHRELVLDRDFFGMTWKQVAEEHGIPSANAARERHRTAMVQLVRLLRACGIQESG